jgi:1,4-alpha-glucan branching enzyme
MALGGNFWREVINTDAAEFGGAGWGNLGGVEAAPCARTAACSR